MTTRFVGASGKNGREREVIPVPEGMIDVKEVMGFFHCDRRTAQATIQRGYYIVGYHRRSVCPGDLDPDLAYRLVWSIYRRKFQDRLPWYVAPEDLVQEGVFRLLEMAGHPRFQEKGFQFYLALNGMKGWIEKQRRLRGGINGTTPGYEENIRQDAWSSWQTSWQATRDEAQRKPKVKPHTCTRSPEAMKKIMRQIYESGEGQRQVGLGRHLGKSARCAEKKMARAIQAGLVENAGSSTECKVRQSRLRPRGGPSSAQRRDPGKGENQMGHRGA